MMNNKLIISLASIVILFGLLYGVYAFTNKPVQTDFTEVTKVLPTDRTKWTAQSKNVLVEYSDLQCPACKNFHDVIKQTIESDKSITENMTFVYRHFPLDNIHPNARAAAYAAEAAGRQGKFFEMSDILFARQDQWSKDSDPKPKFLAYAKELKLSTEDFEKAMDSTEVKEKVQNDFISGTNADVQATPTFYLNGKKVDVNSFDQFKKLLQDTAKQK